MDNRLRFNKKVRVRNEVIAINGDPRIEETLSEINVREFKEINYVLEEAGTAHRKADEIDLTKLYESRKVYDQERNRKNRLYNKAMRHYERVLTFVKESPTSDAHSQKVLYADLTCQLFKCNSEVYALSYENFIKRLKYIKEASLGFKDSSGDLYQEISKVYSQYFNSADEINENVKNKYQKKYKKFSGFHAHVPFHNSSISHTVQTQIQKLNEGIERLKKGSMNHVNQGNAFLRKEDFKQAKTCFENGENCLLQALSLVDQLKVLSEKNLDKIVTMEAFLCKFLLFCYEKSHTASGEDFIMMYRRFQRLVEAHDSVKNSKEGEYFFEFQQSVHNDLEYCKLKYETEAKMEFLNNTIDIEMAEAVKYADNLNQLESVRHYKNAYKKSKQLLELLIQVRTAFAKMNIPVENFWHSDLLEAQLNMVKCLGFCGISSYGIFLTELDSLNTALSNLIGQFPEFSATQDQLVKDIHEFNTSIDREKGEYSQHKRQYEELVSQMTDIGSPRAEVFVSASASASAAATVAPLSFASSPARMFAAKNKYMPILKMQNSEEHTYLVIDHMCEMIQAMSFNKSSEEKAEQIASDFLISLAEIIQDSKNLDMSPKIKNVIIYSLIQTSADLGDEEEEDWIRDLEMKKEVKTLLKYSHFHERACKDSADFNLKNFISDALENLFIEIIAMYSDNSQTLIANILTELSANLRDKKKEEIFENQGNLAQILTQSAHELNSPTAKKRGGVKY